MPSVTSLVISSRSFTDDIQTMGSLLRDLEPRTASTTAIPSSKGM